MFSSVRIALAGAKRRFSERATSIAFPTSTQLLHGILDEGREFAVC